MYVEELAGLRDRSATLNAAGGVERRAAAELDLAATRVASVIEGVYGAEGGQHLPRFRERGSRGPNKRTAARREG